MHYYIRKVQTPASPSEDGVDMTNITDGHVETNTAYGSTYHKVQASDKA